MVKLLLVAVLDDDARSIMHLASNSSSEPSFSHPSSIKVAQVCFVLNIMQQQADVCGCSWTQWDKCCVTVPILPALHDFLRNIELATLMLTDC